MATQWYYKLGAQQVGPVPESRLHELLANRTISAETLVSSDGREWKPLSETTEFGTAAPLPSANWWTDHRGTSSPPAPPVSPPPATESGNWWQAAPPAPQPDPSRPLPLAPPSPAEVMRPESLSWWSEPPPAPPAPPPPPAPQPRARERVAESPLPLTTVVATVPAPACERIPANVHPHAIDGVAAWTATKVYADLERSRRILWHFGWGLPFFSVLVPILLATSLGGGACIWILIAVVAIIWSPSLYLKIRSWLNLQIERKMVQGRRIHLERMKSTLGTYLQARLGEAVLSAQLLPEDALVLIHPQCFCWVNLEQGSMKTAMLSDILEVTLHPPRLTDVSYVVTLETTESKPGKFDFVFRIFLDVVLGGGLLSLFGGWNSEEKRTSQRKHSQTYNYVNIVDITTRVPGVGTIELNFRNQETAAKSVQGELQAALASIRGTGSSTSG